MSAATAIAVAAGLTGAGSTLIQPLMADWQAHSGISVTYSGVGSGDGIADISARSVDFGASDAPLTGAQFAGCHGCIQIPWALTATAVAYHLNGFGKGLHLSPQVVAKIYQGSITKWNSPQIKKLNKHKKLPNLVITPVFRSDGSGDTYAFTDLLSKVSQSWKNNIGRATSVNFPTGVGAAHNSGMVARVAGTNGSIGYVAASYAIAHGLPAAALENADRKFEYPNLPNIADAAKSIGKVKVNQALHLVYPKKKYKTAYPLSTFTYAIAPKTASTNGTLKRFIDYAVTGGQKYAESLDFYPLPKALKKNAEKAAKSLKP